tara:strand:- start:445 stop:594 length:150 start_codon:yes stop_codon:yes gene_type:complete
MHKTYSFLKKGQGKLASNFHGETKFSKERKDKIIKEQLDREKNNSKNSN